MNDLLIKALITVMIIDAGMHFYYDYKKNTYQSLKFLILTVLMAVSVGAALTKQETDNVQQRMKIIEQKIEMQEEGKEPEEDGTIHEMHVHGDADNRHNKGHKEQIKVYKERGINVNDDRARDGKRFVAWKLSMQAVRQKKKEDKNKFYSETKLKCYRRKAMKQKTGRKR